jgi:glyoxylase I family protein
MKVAIESTMRRTFSARLLLAAVLAPGLVLAEPTPVVRLQNLAHAVTSLDKTLPFYRDALGFTVNGTGDPLAREPQKLDDANSRFTNTKGMSFRAASFRIPNAEFGFELTEFTGGARHAGVPNIQDIGAAMLVLRVRDLPSMLAKAMAAGATMVSAGGEPQNNEIIIRDPDGFFVSLEQPATIPAGVTGNILGASINIAVEDTAKSVEFLHKAIGFDARPSSPLASNPAVLKLIGLHDAQWRIAHGHIPGTTADFALIEYHGVPRKKFSPGAEDPGSPAFTMVVHDVNAALKQWVAAGGTVASAGGKAVMRANGSGNVFVRDVNGFTWELIQQPASTADVVGVGNFAHIVADLDRSLGFYRGVLGLKVTGTIPFGPNEAVAKFGHTEGGQSRVAVLKVPGIAMGIELIEYKDIARDAQHPRFYDPGAANFALRIRDLDSLFPQVASYPGVKVITQGGKPVTIKTPNGELHAVFVQDPDGFVVEMLDDPNPPADAPPGPVIAGAAFEASVRNSDESVKFYHDLLGFDLKLGATFNDNPEMAATAGAPGASFKQSTGRIPGTAVPFTLIEFENIEHKRLSGRTQDPGTTVLQLIVHDVAALTAKLKAAGVPIVTTGGEPVQVAPGLKIAIVRDPNDLLLELAERGPR